MNDYLTEHNKILNFKICGEADDLNNNYIVFLFFTNISFFPLTLHVLGLKMISVSNKFL